MIKLVEYKGRRGFSVKGTVEMPKLQNTASWKEKAEWLMAMVESGGTYGTVINYDGTGMTAGLHQAIAVYPANPKVQGPLWRLVTEVRNSKLGMLLLERFKTRRDWDLIGSYVCKGKTPVDGRELRGELTGTRGIVVPDAGRDYERGKEWALFFSEMFSQEETFQAQRDFGMIWIDRVLGTKFAGLSITFSNFIENLLSPQSSNLSEYVRLANELAICVFCSHSVNAPSFASVKFHKVVTEGHKPENFGKELIKRLGNTKFGRWDDDLPNGRYQRTRHFAQQIFPKELFDNNGVMPKDLK